MPLKITENKEYILVELSEGIQFWEVLEAVGKFVVKNEYPEKNDIWVLREGPLDLSVGELYELKDVIKSHYPANSSRTKTAIVAESGIQAGIANMFSMMAEDLPFQIKVFKDLDAAKEWTIK
jgi:hypothetical protein